MKERAIASIIVLLSIPVIFGAYLWSKKNKGTRKWFEDTMEYPHSDGMAMLVLLPIIILDALVHPVQTYRFFTNK